MPPPRVSPAMPVEPTMPPGVASPKAWVAWLKSAHVAPGLRARRRGCRIDPDAGHVGEVDDQGVIPRAKARGAVSSTADRQVQGVVPGEVDAGDDIGHLGYLDHRCRPLIDHAVEDRTCRVVAGVAGRDDLPADLPAQAIELCSVHFVYRRFRREIRPGRFSALPAGVAPGGLPASCLLFPHSPVKGASKCTRAGRTHRRGRRLRIHTRAPPALTGGGRNLWLVIDGRRTGRTHTWPCAN